MNRDCVVVILNTEADFADALAILEEGQVSREYISIASRTVERDTPEVADDLQTGDEAETKTARGAAAGGVIGALGGVTVGMIPGVGPLLVAGALAGALTGGIVGGFLGSLQGWGVHEDHVKRYDQALRAGKIILLVQGDPLIIARAIRSLRPHYPDLHIHAANSADAPELFVETETKRA